MMEQSDESEVRGARAWAVPLLLAAAGILAYAGSFRGVFLFDDFSGICENPALRHPTQWALNTTRPLTALTFRLNLVAGGLAVRGFHIVNLLIHLGAGWLLYGIVRRTLRHRPLPAGPAVSPTAAAGLVSAVWLLHPLQTESVTYISQRAETLMGLFYLWTLYAFIRGATEQPANARRWWMASVLTCALGMATKPVMVTAPLAVLLYDRLFLAGSFRDALRLRGRVYAGLAGTWLILAAILSQHHESDVSAGFGGVTMSSVQYLLTQPGVVLHYLALSVWPRGLCLDYCWPGVDTARQALVPGLAILGLIGLSLWGYVRRNAAGFCGVWFFLMLAPSSSVIPVTDAASEHRVYLALAGVAALGTGLWIHLAQWGADRARLPPRGAMWIGIAGPAAAILVLFAATWIRNRDYASSEAMCRSIMATSPANDRVYVNLSTALLNEGRFSEAADVSAQLLDRLPDFRGRRFSEIPVAPADAAGVRLYIQARLYAHAHNNRGVAMARQGRREEAAAHFREALRWIPQFQRAARNLARLEWEAGQGPREP